jgi:uncharacterized protein
MPQFVVDTILTKDDVCNLEKDFKFLLESMLRGDHIVFYGRRNMGKTSLIQAKVIPAFRSQRKQAVVVFVDFMGVQSEEETILRVKLALERALVEAYPTHSRLKKMAGTILGLRPTIQIDGQSGELKLTLEGNRGSHVSSLHEIFDEVKNISNETPILLVFDEFQDIINIKGMDAKIRSELQKLPAKLPTIMMGSKKHLLARLFSLPKAPLAGWGIDYEISTIQPSEFVPYLNLRFKPFRRRIDLDITSYLCDMMESIPEAIIYVCIALCRPSPRNQISRRDVDAAIEKTVSLRRGRYEESLQLFSKSERQFLKVIAKQQPVESPTGKDFIHESKLSSAGILKIIKKMEDYALLYRTKNGISLSDPLLARYIRSHW